MTALDDFKRFVTDEQGAAYYKKWIADNSGLAQKWYTFRDEILNGGRPTPPDMAGNKYGMGLVDAGIQYLNSTAPAPVAPSTVSNSLTPNATLKGTYSWLVKTTGDCVKVEFWASSPAIGNKLLGSDPPSGVAGARTSWSYSFDTTKFADGSYVFGIVLIDSAGQKHYDENRITAVISNGVAPPPPPPPAGGVKKLLDYSTGDLSQWGNDVQKTAGCEITVVDAPYKGKTQKWAKFHTPQWNDSMGERNRCQVSLDADKNHGQPGMEEWYSFSFMIPSSAKLDANQGWNNLVSWHHANSGGGNHLIAPAHWAFSTDGSGIPRLYLTANGGKWRDDPPYIELRKDWTFGVIPRDTPQDCVLHVLWSADPTKGFFEAWVNGQNVLPFTRLANLYWKYPDGAGGVMDWNYIKQGYDTHGNYSGATDILQTNTTIATDKDSAFAALA